jgi:hypothetical protein
MKRLAFLLAFTAALGACNSGKLSSGCGREPEPTPAPAPWVAQVESEPEQPEAPEAPPLPAPDPESATTARKNEKPERPWAENTGPSKPELLVKSGPLMIETDGAVYENIDVTGDLWIDADNVTIRNFRINANGESYGINVLEGHRGVVLEDGEIFGMTSAGVLGVGLTARRLHIHDSSGDGMKIQGEGGPSLVESCFIEKLGTDPEAHADGNQTRGGSNITFRYNNIYMPAPGTPKYPGSPYKSNSAFFLQLDVSNFVIEHNWLTGGNYTIYCITNGGGVSVRNNIFGRENGGLPEGSADRRILSGQCDTWSGNVWEHTGRPL